MWQNLDSTSAETFSPDARVEKHAFKEFQTNDATPLEEMSRTCRHQEEADAATVKTTQNIY